ncbi:hypothetical protein [Bosea sp. (in: a-proteobacteria)]|uniref:hypothetical protein n=1 Tax=Bosea sp. (in: a-proteobacteria) TaxID=1871050 RepID=UPI002FC78635
MVSKGRVIGVLFGLFALVCLFATYDFSRGRATESDSPLVGDLLSATKARECGRDATEIVARYLPIGMGQAEAEKILAQTVIRAPTPWFWRPVNENSTVWNGDSLEALRTIKITAFGNQLLRLYLGFSDGKLHKLAAEVICRFD